jgi:hypothetical protein
MALSPEQTSAVLVTRGDVDLAPVLDSLPFDDIVVWDNSKRKEDLKVFGRYAAVKEVRHSVIYTQDDDCVVDVGAVLAAYEPGRVVSNMPAAKRSEYRGIAPGVALVGWGACFDADCTLVLDRYIARYGRDELLLRECDRVFTSLTPQKLIDVSVTHRPHAFAGRMGNETRHLTDLAEIQRRIASL